MLGHLARAEQEHGIGAAIRFDPADCAACPSRADCTRDLGGRQITLPPRDLHDIQQANRADQADPDWQRLYNRRAAIEATLSEAIRAYGLRHTRHRGQARTHVRHMLIACGMNAARIADWHSRGDVPARQRPRTRFVKLEADGNSELDTSVENDRPVISRAGSFGPIR